MEVGFEPTKVASNPTRGNFIKTRVQKPMPCIGFLGHCLLKRNESIMKRNESIIWPAELLLDYDGYT